MQVISVSRKILLACTALGTLTFGALADPWVQPGDAELRSDIILLASAGVIDNVTMQWPLPWGGILYRLDDTGSLAAQPDYIRDAADRVRSRGLAETRTHEVRLAATIDLTNDVAIIRAFDALGREKAQGQASAEYLFDTSAIHVAVGSQKGGTRDHQSFVADGSFLAQRIGNAAIYAGYVPHWWGPGWISAMSLSTNARPMPQIGLTRISTTPFDSPWLSWMGAWQAEFFVGVLDGPRLARNTIYDGFRFALSPLPHLEIGISRTDMMCGTGHPCKPLVGYLNLNNQGDAANIVNDEGAVDIRYSGAFGHFAYEIYAQAMNEDTNPVVHSGSSHLYGGSAWLPLAGGIGRLTVEYADSNATKDLWGSGVMHGVAYNNWQYPDGMHYRGQTLGFSLDSDSRLLSVQASFTDRQSRSFSLTYHRADISDPRNLSGNSVTTSPVNLNIVQARVSWPFDVARRRLRIDLEGRYQSDRPRPDRGANLAVEVALSAGL